MTSENYFNAVMDQADAFLSEYGFKRSGRSCSFYHINAERTRGCMIAFRRSIYDTPDMKEYGINYVCMKSADMTSADMTSAGTTGETRITVSLLKRQPAMNGLGYDVFRICGQIVGNEPAESYFTKTIRPKLMRILAEYFPVSRTQL